MRRSSRSTCTTLTLTCKEKEAGFALWTMEQISDLKFSQVDWTALADDLFGELHGIK